MPLKKSKPKFSETLALPQLKRDARMNDLPAFPQFDSLPATAGLTNLEAFQLSVRHALTLLPLISERSLGAFDEPERFSLG